jgi:large subunit ribosomal protein L25
LYGAKFETLALTIPKRDFSEISTKAGEATIINLEVPGKEPFKVLIRHIQHHPVTDDLVHVDLYKVDMKKTIQTEIPLEFIGISPAVEELEGNLITNKDSIKVECLPDKLVSKIEVDVSRLKTFQDLIHVRDLPIPEGIKILDEADDVVAQVTEPRSEEELEAMEEEAKTAAEAEKAQIEDIEAKAEAEKATKEPETEAPQEAVQTGPAPEQAKENVSKE